LAGRQAFSAQLASYLERYRSDLSPDSIARLNRGCALRILDSNEECDQRIVRDEACPRLRNYLDATDLERFEYILQGLEALEIPYQVDDQLVRGLDYYDHTIFEFLSKPRGGKDRAKPQAVLAGGRYNGLSAQMNGPDLPAIGYAHRTVARAQAFLISPRMHSVAS